MHDRYTVSSSLKGKSSIRTTRFALGVVTLLLWFACAAPVEYHGRKVGGGLIFWGVQTDIAMGQEFIDELEAEGIPYLEVPEVKNTVNRITQRLQNAVPETFPQYPFQFETIDDCVVNAFALPGGPIRLHRGLLKLTEKESELAGVLAHEMGHVLGRHGAKHISDLYLKLGLLTLATGIAEEIERGNCKEIDKGDCATPWSEIIGVVGFLGVSLSSLAHSRSQESEADWIGTHLMMDAGYDPEGLASVFEKFEQLKVKQGVKDSFLNRILSTHPPDRQRFTKIREIKANAVNARQDLILTTPSYGVFVQNFANLPPAQYDDALTTLECRSGREECRDRREECLMRIVTCDDEKEDCQGLKEQCKYIDQECRDMDKQCDSYERSTRNSRPSC